MRVHEISAQQIVVTASWQQYAQHQTDILFDHFSEFLFFLHVWGTNAETIETRLFVFSDFYLSDCVLSNAVLHDVLALASALSLSLAAAGEAETDRTAAGAATVFSSHHGFLLVVRPVHAASSIR